MTVSFSGTSNYSLTHNQTWSSFLGVAIPKVFNKSASAVSGQLSVEVWLLTTPYTGGTPVGFKMASYSYASTLAPGALAAAPKIEAQDVTSSIASASGTYRVALILVEKTGAVSKYDDWINYPGTASVTPSPRYDGPGGAGGGADASGSGSAGSDNSSGTGGSSGSGSGEYAFADTSGAALDDGTTSNVTMPSGANYIVSSANTGVHMGGGNSSVMLSSLKAVVYGDAGADYITDAGISSVIRLGSGNTTVNATSGGPLVTGSSTSGSLFFSGGAGASTVYAGTGATTVFSNAGGGQFFAGNATAMLFVGGRGASTVVGGAGSTTLFGGSSGHDLLVAGSGPSTVVGSGDGIVIVGRGNAGDILVAGPGAETLVGSADGGNDILFAGTGRDALFGGTGSNTFVAAKGGAEMIAGPGHAGRDLFIFSNGAVGSSNRIWNFIQGQDHVGLFGYGTTAVTNALATATVAGGSTTVTLPDNTSIIFTNISSLTRADFT